MSPNQILAASHPQAQQQQQQQKQLMVQQAAMSHYQLAMQLDQIQQYLVHNQNLIQQYDVASKQLKGRLAQLDQQLNSMRLQNQGGNPQQKQQKQFLDQQRQQCVFSIGQMENNKNTAAIAVQQLQVQFQHAAWQQQQYLMAQVQQVARLEFRSTFSHNGKILTSGCKKNPIVHFEVGQQTVVMIYFPKKHIRITKVEFSGAQVCHKFVKISRSQNMRMDVQLIFAEPKTTPLSILVTYIISGKSFQRTVFIQ
jgi:hypothetical protein